MDKKTCKNIQMVNIYFFACSCINIHNVHENHSIVLKVWIRQVKISIYQRLCLFFQNSSYIRNETLFLQSRRHPNCS